MNGLRPNEQNFVVNLLNILLQYQQNPQIIYPLFQANLDKLTVDFAQRLRAWGESQIRQLPPEDSQTTAALLSWFSDLILYFPLGDKTANIAIAKAGYECSLTFYTRETNPFAWAEIQINLGVAYEEDTQADTVQKWEEAINCYQTASQIFTRALNPERWASIQENLGNAYRNREQGKVEINLQQAIQYHQNALEVFNPHTNERFWGISQHNLGNDYLALSRLNIANNEQCLESAIEHYEQALQTLKRERYPDLWAMNQLSLGKAYSVRLRGNIHENHKKAQQHYENALSIYTPQTYPEYYQQAKEGQARLNQLKTNSNRETPEESSFIVQVLKLTLASEADTQKVFPFLEKNLDRLNQKFIEELRIFVSTLGKKSDQMPIYESFMMGIYVFSSLIKIFPKGNRKNNVDIAIAGWQIVLPFFSQYQNHGFPAEFSSLLGMIKLQLGDAFYEKYDNRWGDIDVNVEQAIKFFEEGFALLIYENTPEPDFWEDCQKRLGIAYHKRYEIKGDPNDIEKSIEAYKLALTSDKEDTSWWAGVQMNLGNAYCDRQGNPLENLNDAIECYENSLKVRKEDTYPTEWADVQSNLGQAYYRKGMLGGAKSQDIESAIQCYKDALRVYNDPQELRWGLLKKGLGICYSDRSTGNYAENLELSIGYFNEALTVITRNTYPYEWGRIQKTLGIIYLQRKQGGRGDRVTNLQAGIKCCEGALQVFNPQTYPVDWAETQANLSILYRVLAEFIEPQENLKKAISYATNAEPQFRNQPQKWAKSQYELGTLYKNLGVFAKENTKENLAKAIECYQNALRCTSRENYPWGWAEVNNSLGNAYQHNGQYQQAIKCFENTLKIHTREAFPTDYIKTKVNLANAHVKNEKLEEAFKNYEEAINTLEDLLSKLATDDDAKRKLGEEWFKIYQYMIVACLKLGKQNREYYATAWEYVERSKARRLVELFGQTKPNYVSDDIWKEFQDLRNQVTNEQKRIEDKEKSIILSNEAWPQYPELDSKKANLKNLKQQLNQNLNDYPRLAATQRVQYTPFSKIGEKLSDDHTVIIQWYLLEADQKFCAFIYTRQSFQPYVWESSPQDFDNLQQWYQEYFVNYISDFSEWSNKLSDRLNRLAKILHIDELLNYLPKTCQQVILIPHRYLHLLPIHALPIKPETWQKFNPNSTPNQDNYLFECFTKGVRYAPSCETLLMLEKRSRPNFSQLLAIQNPTNDLRYADLEVQAILNYFDSNSRKVFAHKDATKAKITLTDYLNAHCIHFSCHGTFNLESPIESGLRLANEEEILTVGEIFSFDLRQCPLVVLSACETGMIDPNSITDEYIGLSSAFLYAGASNLVSSLWTVNDCSSAFLLIKFYQTLVAQTEGEKNVIQALREAQKWLRNVTGSDLNRWMLQNKLNQLRQMLNNNPLPNNDKPFSSPYYWAAFCVIGK
jgi:CHAT domain-containing protein